jgi:hypothetical protein
MYTTMANTLRELGYVVVVPDYRKYPQVKADKMYHDVRKAIRWAYTHAHEINGDTEQIHVMVNSFKSQQLWGKIVQSFTLCFIISHLNRVIAPELNLPHKQFYQM